MQPLKYICALTVCLTAPLLMAGEATSNIPIDRTYIAGFLSGAQLTDGEIIRRFDKADNGKEQSDFFQRAFKTRVGERRTVPATYFAGFCLPEDTVNEGVINKVQKALEKSGKNTDSEKADLVFRAVQTAYPCR